MGEHWLSSTDAPLPTNGKLTEPVKGRTMILQADGNLVLYPTSEPTPGTALWLSGVVSGPLRYDYSLIMRPNGNLVILQADKEIWSSKSAFDEGETQFFLNVQENDMLAIYQGDSPRNGRIGRVVWMSNGVKYTGIPIPPMRKWKVTICTDKSGNVAGEFDYDARTAEEATAMASGVLSFTQQKYPGALICSVRPA